eukprot:1967517-Rhodomonas_salina.1
MVVEVCGGSGMKRTMMAGGGLPAREVPPGGERTGPRARDRGHAALPQEEHAAPCRGRQRASGESQTLQVVVLTSREEVAEVERPEIKDKCER